MAELTRSYLQEMATPQSFARGESYYDGGGVVKVTRTGNTYKGVVQGTHRYKVTVVEKEGEFWFSCTCPYDWGGICKHCVAVGLAIINGEYTEVGVPPPAELLQTEIPDLPVEELLEKSTPEQQRAFLESLLQKSSEVRRQFYTFVFDPPSGSDRGISIDQVRKAIADGLRSLDMEEAEIYFDAIYEEHQEYIPEWEIYYEAAYRMVREVFDPYQKNALELVKQGQWVEGFKILLGMFEGHDEVWEPGNDPEEYVDDFRGVTQTEFQEKVKEFEEALNEVVKSDAAVEKALDVFFERVRIHGVCDEETMDELEEGEVAYKIDMFEGLLISLVTNPHTANYLYHLLQQHDLLDHEDTSDVQLHIARITGDDSLWFEVAEKFAPVKSHIAKQLLERYAEKGDLKNMARVGREIFNHYTSVVDELLVTHLTPEMDRELYTRALASVVRRTEDTRRYGELRSLLSEEAREEFLASVRDQVHFYVKLLWLEERYDEILQIVREYSQSHSGEESLSIYPANFSEIIRPILNIYPQECFDILQKQVNHLLENYRGREIYRQVVRLLKEMIKIEDYKTQARDFVVSVYNWTPRLPALRDEMKKGGLV